MGGRGSELGARATRWAGGPRELRARGTGWVGGTRVGAGTETPGHRQHGPRHKVRRAAPSPTQKRRQCRALTESKRAPVPNTESAGLRYGERRGPTQSAGARCKGARQRAADTETQRALGPTQIAPESAGAGTLHGELRGPTQTGELCKENSQKIFNAVIRKFDRSQAYTCNAADFVSNL